MASFPKAAMLDSLHPSILRHFARIEDPRQNAKVLYPLAEVLLLALAATIAGADDFVETTLWGENNLAFLRRFLPYGNGIPSHDTLCDVFAAIDPELFKTCFLTWVAELRDPTVPELIAIDGKTSRRTHDRGKGRKPLCIWCPPGRPARDWCRGNKQRRRSPMKSPPFRCC
jgi:hypothetical protein